MKICSYNILVIRYNFKEKNTFIKPYMKKKGSPKKVVMNGAECSQQNGKNNKKILRFFFQVIKNWGDLFTKITITKKIKIGEF